MLLLNYSVPIDLQCPFIKIPGNNNIPPKFCQLYTTRPFYTAYTFITVTNLVQLKLRLIE